MGARVEVLTYLWTHERGHGRLITERALYAKTVVAHRLSDLSAAKLASRRESGRQVLYRLEPGLAALGRPIAAYVDWASTLRGVVLIWRELQVWPEGDEVGHAEASRLARALSAARPDLAAEGFEYHIPELHGWVACEGDVPVRLAEEVAQRVEEFVHRLASSLARKRARVAFPGEFTRLAVGLKNRLVEKHGRQTNEGQALRALREIRVRAAPS